MNGLVNPADLAASLVYSIIGILVFCTAFIVVDKLTPYDLWKELVENRNMALGLVVAAMCLGISIIVAAAISG